MKIHFCLSALCLVLATITLHALPVRVLAWDEEIAARKLAIVDGKGAQEIQDLHQLSRSAPLDVQPGQETPPRIQALDRMNAEGAPAADPIRFPNGIKRPLILLLPDAKAATGIRPMVIEDDIAGFGWGTIRLINATGKPLLVKCEEKVSNLPAGWDPVDVKLGGEARNFEVVAALRDQPKQLLYSSIWEYRENQRQLVFVLPNPDVGHGALLFKFIMENRVDAEAARAAAP